jgi:purine-binding chemotaxis protein CheW
MSLPTPEPNDELPHHARFRDRVRSRTGRADLFVFRVGDERFAVDVRAVDEVIENPMLYAVPDVDAGVAGVCSHAGGPLPVVRAAAVLGVAASDPETVLVMRRGSDRLGLFVDDVDDVATVQLDGFRGPPYDEEDDFLVAVFWDGRRLTSILDARAVVGAGAALLSPSLQ